jgi:hypothetical protein
MGSLRPCGLFRSLIALLQVQLLVLLCFPIVCSFVLVCLLVGEVFKFTASLVIPFAFVAILFETMEDVLLPQAIASEAGCKGQ